MGKSKQMNTGVIDKLIVGDKKTCVLAKTEEKLPKYSQRCYYNNKEFIGMLACVWNRYCQEHKHGFYITPTYLSKYLKMYDIRTNRGTEYVPFSRGPFNLLRAAYNYYEALEKSELKKSKSCLPGMKAGFVASAKHFGIIKSLIAEVFVNRYAQHAWE